MLWTKKRLKRAILSTIRDPEFKFKLGVLRDCRAKLVRSEDGSSATIDPFQSSLIEGGIHEATHHVLDGQLGVIFSSHESVPSLYETIMDALEKAIAEDVMSTEEETAQWRAAIDAKLGR